jgi:hypothetical protein
MYLLKETSVEVWLRNRVPALQVRRLEFKPSPTKKKEREREREE